MEKSINYVGVHKLSLYLIKKEGHPHHKDLSVNIVLFLESHEKRKQTQCVIKTQIRLMLQQAAYTDTINI
jgi:hypothetical protein